MTLDEHLAGGYDCYQHGKLKPWTRAGFAAELRESAELLADAKRKVRELESVRAAGRGCHISGVQLRILQDGIRAAAVPA